MAPELILLISTAVKTTIQEILFWSQGKTREEIIARKEQEEQKTQDLMARLDAVNGDPYP